MRLFVLFLARSLAMVYAGVCLATFLAGAPSAVQFGWLSAVFSLVAVAHRRDGDE